MSTVIDVHTHMLSQAYLDCLRHNGAPQFTFRGLPEGGEVIDMNGAPFFTLLPEMLDFEARIGAMDAAGVDLAVISLTAPNAYFGDAEVSLEAACLMNDRFAAHGGGALPFLAARLDLCYERIPACGALARRRPSEYLSGFYVDAVVHRQDVLEMCIRSMGPENVVYGSDYPHNIGDMAGCLARVDALAGETRDRVRSRNAARLFGL